MTQPTSHHPTAAGQPADDLAAIRATALDYAQGYYEGDAERMRRSLHPDLAKRTLYRDEQTGVYRVHETSQRQLVEITQRGGGSRIPAEQRIYDVTILDIYGDIACVRADSYLFVDYLHVARWEGRWVIVNALYAENRPNVRP